MLNSIRLCLWLSLALGLCLLPARARADDLEEAHQSAIFLLRSSMQVHRDGRHNVLLRALRHLRDPELVPFFEELAQSEHPSLKIHGILGLAECDPQRRLDLTRIAAIESAAVQAETISAAAESDLLSVDHCRQLLAWPGLDEGVRVFVATHLARHEQLTSLEVLRSAAESDSFARRHLAHLLLLQQGETASLKVMEALNRSEEIDRDQVREMLLRTAARFEFDKLAPWALQVAGAPGVNSRLALIALSAAMRFGTPGAAELWRQQLASTSDPAQRTRLALVALRNAPHLEAAVFAPLASMNDPMLQRMGKAGAAIAARQGVAAAVTELIQLQHAVANEWVLTFAREDAGSEEAQQILLALMRSYPDAPERARALRLEDAIAATEILVQRLADAPAAILRPLLTAADTDPKLVEAILLGLIRCREPAVTEAVKGVSAFPSLRAQSLALLLLAKHGQELSREQLSDLALQVRGGGTREDALRVQAAWTYLKLTHQTRSAVSEVVAQRF